MDLLHHVLESLRVVDAALGLFDCVRPWSFQRAPMPSDLVALFSPLERSLTVQAGTLCEEVRPGDTAVVLSGGFSVYSDPQTPAIPFLDAWTAQGLAGVGRDQERRAPERFSLPGAGRLAAGPIDRFSALALQVEDVAQSPVLSMLPSLIVIRREHFDTLDWPTLLHRFIEGEIACPRPGYNTTARHLVNTMFVALLRTYVLQDGIHREGWMRGMTDGAVGRALTLLHARPADPWTLESLARSAGLSRSNLAQRFKALVGRTPIDYLTSVRMQAAAQRLLRGEAVSSVCTDVGYGSPFAFREAFTREFGMKPSDYVRARAAGYAAER